MLQQQAERLHAVRRRRVEGDGAAVGVLRVDVCAVRDEMLRILDVALAARDVQRRHTVEVAARDVGAGADEVLDRLKVVDRGAVGAVVVELRVHVGHLLATRRVDRDGHLALALLQLGHLGVRHACRHHQALLADRMQWRRARGLLDVVHAEVLALDQQLHRLDVVVASCNVQQCRGCGSRERPLGALGEQPVDHPLVVILRAEEERGAALLSLRVGALRDEELGRFRHVALDRRKEGRLAGVAGLRKRIGAVLEQDFDHGHVALGRHHVHAHRAVADRALHVRAVLEHHLDNLVEALAAREIVRRHLVALVGLVEARAALDEHLHHLHIAAPGRKVDRLVVHLVGLVDI
mmetsp:Transcript_10944/g.27261  ORF Transcript_10944/g.27261 Transcript_10944/m.27261 type:complete len:350 (+) Transcript_10944:1026-2075(+)